MRKYIVLFIVFLAVAPAVQALGFYVGASVGEAGDLDVDDLDAPLTDFGLDSDGETWKVFGGVGIGRVFGVEAAWHDLGSVTCCVGVADAGFRLGVEGISVAAVAGLPITRFRLFAKAGIFSWEVDGEEITFAGPVAFSADGEDLMGGVGADFKVTRSLFVRAEWEIFQIDDGTLDAVSVGVQFKF